jgi:methylated-DNA-protein-cysteine methyltransferase related protein
MIENKTMTPFTANVIKLIKAIPKGKVATYGQIAELAGKPGAARAVVGILGAKKRDYKLPWQRVIGSGGKIAFPKGSDHFRLQARMLKAEGVLFISGKTDILKYGWKRKPLSYTRKQVPRMFG